MKGIRTVPAGRGAAWLLEGFDYFKSDVPAWVGIAIIVVVISSIALLIPFGGLLLQLLFPVLMGGLMMGCREVANGGEIKVNDLFGGFRRYTSELFLLGIIYTIGAAMILAVMVIMVMLAIGSMVMVSSIMEGDVGFLLANLQILLLIVLIGLALYLPLLMAFWFGPALIVFEGQNAVTAMKNSFKGCIKNVLPFLVYGLVAMVLSILASMPFMLGWIILLPMTIAGLYISYKDIYTAGPGTLIAQA